MMARRHIPHLAVGLTVSAGALFVGAGQASARIVIDDPNPVLEVAMGTCLHSGRNFWYTVPGDPIIGGICATNENNPMWYDQLIFNKQGRLIIVCESDDEGLEICSRVP